MMLQGMFLNFVGSLALALLLLVAGILDVRSICRNVPPMLLQLLGAAGIVFLVCLGSYKPCIVGHLDPGVTYCRNNKGAFVGLKGAIREPKLTNPPKKGIRAYSKS